MQCRLCLKDEIEQNDGLDFEQIPEIVGIIRDTLSIEVNFNDEYPRSICLQCYENLMNYSTFRIQCIDNQKTLKLNLIRKRVASLKKDSQVAVTTVKDESVKSDNKEPTTTMEVEEKMPTQVQEQQQHTPEYEPPSSSSSLSKENGKSRKRIISEGSSSSSLSLDNEVNIPKRVKNNLRNCSVMVERLPEKILERFRRQTNNSWKPEKTTQIQVVRTYCKTVEKYTSSPPPATSCSTTSHQPQQAPRIKVLSSSEINSLVPEPQSTPKDPNRKLSCTLVKKHGRLEFIFTDHKGNMIDFWTMTETQRKDILQTLMGERIKLEKSFSTIPITHETKAKLESLYGGNVPFHVLLENVKN